VSITQVPLCRVQSTDLHYSEVAGGIQAPGIWLNMEAAEAVLEGWVTRVRTAIGCVHNL
jgi:hypothetical protein